MSTAFEPNEFVGYRIKPDWYSFNVVLVKLHGPNSAQAGKEYETPVAYCKELATAANWIFTHAARVRGGMNQQEQEALDGNVADAKALASAFAGAQEQTLAALAELQARITEVSKTHKDLVKLLRAKPL
jgi:hypothetical protein